MIWSAIREFSYRGRVLVRPTLVALLPPKVLTGRPAASITYESRKKGVSGGSSGQHLQALSGPKAPSGPNPACSGLRFARR